MEEEMMVRLVQLAQVVVVWFERHGVRIAPAAVEAPEQHVGRRLQIHDEIGGRYVLSEQIVQSLVDEQFVVVEIEVREDLVLVEEVIGDRDLVEEVCLS